MLKGALMMKNFLVIIIILVFFTLFFKIIFNFNKKKYAYLIKGTSQSNYFIQFSGVEVPDLKANSRLADVIFIKYTIKNGYCVSSKINDSNLKELIMKEYDLKSSHVTVTIGHL